MDKWSELYRMLADSRRRHALDYLDRRGEKVDVRDLADRVREREDGAGEGEGLVDAEAVYVSLQHVHLPLLDDARLVEWDREKGVVSLGLRAEELPLFGSTHGGLIDITRSGPEATVESEGERTAQSETD